MESEVNYIFLQERTCPFMCKLVDLGSESIWSAAKLGLGFTEASVRFSLLLASNIWTQNQHFSFCRDFGLSTGEIPLCALQPTCQILKQQLGRTLSPRIPLRESS